MSKKQAAAKSGKHTGLKVFLGFLLVALVAAGGVFGYNSYLYMRNKQKEEKRQEALKASYQQEVDSMQKVYKQWTEAVNTDTIYPGVSAMGVDLGGLTQEEAAAALDNYYSDAVLDKTITLTYNGTKWEYTYRDLDFAANTAEIAQEAYDMCRTGSTRERYAEVTALAAAPVDLALSDQYDSSAVDRILSKIDEEIRKEPKDADVKFENGDFVIVEEQTGYDLDQADTKKKLTELIASQEDITLELTVKVTEPKVKKEDLKGFGDVIGTFNTYFDLENTARNRNLEVGCAKISGRMMQPGESFNFNETVSPVDTSEGYMEASTIQNGQYVPGMGGGLCQVSTTLYNAVIRAELEVTERYPHSLEPGYVVNGQDAAIAIGGKNFQFVNSSKYPIYLQMSAYDGVLNCTIYGVEEDPGREVSFESEFIGSIAKPDPIITYSDSMYEDEQEVTSYGREGLKYDVYKIVTQNGETTREYFNSSTYVAVADRITKGTMKRPEPEPEPEPEEESEEETTEESAEETTEESAEETTEDTTEETTEETEDASYEEESYEEETYEEEAAEGGEGEE